MLYRRSADDVKLEKDPMRVDLAISLYKNHQEVAFDEHDRFTLDKIDYFNTSAEVLKCV